jgi:hypothetical protein
MDSYLRNKILIRVDSWGGLWSTYIDDEILINNVSNSSNKTSGIKYFFI